MPLPASRSVVIISGLLTLLVLGGGTLAVGLHNGWLRAASDSPSRETAAASAQPTPTGNDRDAVARLTEPSPRLRHKARFRTRSASTGRSSRRHIEPSMMPMPRSARCSRRSPSSPPHEMTMKGSGSTMAMTIVVDANLTDAAHTTTNEREAATPCGDQER